MSVAVPISSDKNISSDEDKDVRRRTVNSNTNNFEYNSTESSYESPSKGKRLWSCPWTMQHFNNTAAGKTSSKETKRCSWDWLLGHLTKN